MSILDILFGRSSPPGNIPTYCPKCGAAIASDTVGLQYDSRSGEVLRYRTRVYCENGFSEDGNTHYADYWDTDAA